MQRTDKPWHINVFQILCGSHMRSLPEFKFPMLLPLSRVASAAGVWIGQFSAVALQDIAGMSYSTSVPFSYRAPVLFLSSVGAIVIAWALLSCSERWINGKEEKYGALPRRIWISAVIVLCVAAPVLLHSIPIELSFPAAFVK